MLLKTSYRNVKLLELIWSAEIRATKWQITIRPQSFRLGGLG